MELAKLVLPGIVIVTAVALCTYAIGYQKHFVRIAEMTETGFVPRHWRRSRVGSALERIVLRTPFQRGCFRFVEKTLLRSEAHRLVVTAVGGLALVLATQSLMHAFVGAESVREAAMSADALSIPFILTFLLIVGLRAVFEIPVELRANWIFQLTLDREQQECEPLARRVILFAVLPGIVSITFLAYLYVAGVVIATLHALLVTVWALLLTDLLLIRFRKLPFTCSFPVFKQHSIVILISFCFGFLISAVSTPDFESAALLKPWRLLTLLPAVALAWYIPYHLARGTVDVERKLIFEEVPARSVQVLQLGD